MRRLSAFARLLRDKQIAATVDRWGRCVFTSLQTRRSTRWWANMAGAIKIKLRASAVEGKANAALISFLAERLNVPARTIVLLRGHKSRDKLVRVDNLSEEEVRRRLL